MSHVGATKGEEPRCRGVRGRRKGKNSTIVEKKGGITGVLRGRVNFMTRLGILRDYEQYRRGSHSPVVRLGGRGNKVALRGYKRGALKKIIAERNTWRNGRSSYTDIQKMIFTGQANANLPKGIPT